MNWKTFELRQTAFKCAKISYGLRLNVPLCVDFSRSNNIYINIHLKKKHVM